MEIYNLINLINKNGIDIVKTYGINTSYEDFETHTLYIFSLFRSNLVKPIDEHTKLICNGLILEHNKELNLWRPIYIPNKSPIRNYKEIINSHISAGHDIYCLNDGTIINMYYYNGWRMSSRTSTYINNIYMTKNKTFMELFDESLKYSNSSYDILCESLEKNKTYSFGFKHKDFHMFNIVDEPYKVWVNYYRDEDLNLHITPVLGFNPAQTTDINMYNSLKNKCDNSLNAFYNNSQICYGFLIHKYGTDEFFLLESKLLNKIKMLIYNTKLLKKINENQLDKDVYITLHAYLDFRDRRHFSSLFTHLSSKYYPTFTKIINNTVNNIINRKDDDKTVKYLTNKCEKFFAINEENIPRIKKIITINEFIHYYYSLYPC